MSISSLEARKQRWLDFYDANQPARHLFLIRYLPDLSERPNPHPFNKQARIEWAWQQYQLHQQRLEWLDDDSLPYLDALTGTEIFAEALGCSVHRVETEMPFALPRIHDASEVASVKVPSLDAPSLALAFEIADELYRRAGPGALVRMVDVQSPMDIAALIWDKNNFYAALIESPDAVRELVGKVQELLTTFCDEWFARYGHEHIAHYPDYYVPRGITLSEDEIGSVSPQMFVRFFLPELVTLSNRYGSLGMHCCANARHQWANFKKIPHLRMLNLVQPPDVLREAYACFAGYAPQMHSWGGDGDPWTWPERYPTGGRIVLETYTSSREHALEVSEKVRAACSVTLD